MQLEINYASLVRQDYMHVSINALDILYVYVVVAGLY